jgi:hypothetical protein
MASIRRKPVPNRGELEESQPSVGRRPARKPVGSSEYQPG